MDPLSLQKCFYTNFSEYKKSYPNWYQNGFPIKSERIACSSHCFLAKEIQENQSNKIRLIQNIWTTFYHFIPVLLTRPFEPFIKSQYTQSKQILYFLKYSPENLQAILNDIKETIDTLDEIHSQKLEEISKKIAMLFYFFEKSIKMGRLYQLKQKDFVKNVESVFILYFQQLKIITDGKIDEHVFNKFAAQILEDQSHILSNAIHLQSSCKSYACYKKIKSSLNYFHESLSYYYFNQSNASENIIHSLEIGLEEDTIRYIYTITDFYSYEVNRLRQLLFNDVYFFKGWNSYIKKVQPNQQFAIKKLANLYKQGDQVRFGQLLQASCEMTYALKRHYRLNFYQVIALLGAFRSFMSQCPHFDHNQLPSFYWNEPSLIKQATTEMTAITYGMPRYHPAVTFIRAHSHYNYLENYLKDKAPQTQLKTEKPEDYVFDLNLYQDEQIIHTSPDLIHKGWKHVQIIYEQALSSVNPKEILFLSGKLFWLICQLKPWYWGDPSIAEKFIRVLWLEKNMPNLSWKEDIIPWGQVVIEQDIENFALTFHSLFNEPKTFE